MNIHIPLALSLNEIFILGTFFVMMVLGVIIFSLVSAWVDAQSSGYPVSMWKLFVMRWFLKLPHGLIVDAYIAFRKAGVPVTVEEMADLYVSNPDQFAEDVQKLIGKRAPPNE